MKFVNFIRDIKNGELKDKEVLHTLGNIYNTHTITNPTKMKLSFKPGSEYDAFKMQRNPRKRKIESNAIFALQCVVALRTRV